MGTKGKLLIIALLMSGIVSLLVWSKNGDRKKMPPASGTGSGAVESGGPLADDAYGSPSLEPGSGDPNHVTPAEPVPADSGIRIESADSGSRLPAVSDNATHQDPPAGPAPAATSRTYKVEAGDSLARISMKVYGKEKYWRQIFEANKDKMSSPDDLLRVGTALAIPAIADAAAVQPPAPRNETPREVISSEPPRNEAPKAPAPKTYKVKAGDTLSSIAKAQLGDANKWKAIFSANRDKLTSPDSLWEGLELQIP
ncbi:MAG: LysM peptidoglycan-binding domain-containing protein [Planctomycetia bacterium]|nr:LysM peptidoglycan-binding domain-containing protein [Planctomycetia bacterium]